MVKPATIRCTVPGWELFNHYQQLLGKAEKTAREEGDEGGGEDTSFGVGIIEQDRTPFTIDEIEAVVAKLKSNKSRGGSWVASELLRGYGHDDLV